MHVASVNKFNLSNTDKIIIIVRKIWGFRNSTCIYAIEITSGDAWTCSPGQEQCIFFQAVTSIFCCLFVDNVLFFIFFTCLVDNLLCKEKFKLPYYSEIKGLICKQVIFMSLARCMRMPLKQSSWKQQKLFITKKETDTCKKQM